MRFERGYSVYEAGLSPCKQPLAMYDERMKKPMTFRMTRAVCIVGVIVSAGLWRAAVERDRRAAAQAFADETERIADAVHREFDLYLEVLESLGRLHTVSGDIGPEDFEEFVDKGLVYHRAILGTFGWVPTVAFNERPVYEQAMRNAGHPGYRMLEFDEEGQLKPAARRGAYFPVSYVQPETNAVAPRGLDLGSDEHMLKAIQYSLLNKKPAMASVPHPVAGDSAFFTFYPIFGGRMRNQSLQGFVFAVMQPEALLGRALANAPVQELEVTLREDDAARAPNGLTQGPTLQGGAPQKAGTLQRAMRISVGELAFMLTCTAGDRFVYSRQTAVPVVVLISGLLISFLAALLTQIVRGRTRRIEETVVWRTAQLREARDKLEQEISRRKGLEREMLDIGNREQLRVGQDLHDSLGQKLTGIAFLARALTRRLKQEKHATAEEAEQITGLTREAVTQTRRIARGLSPVDMTEGGLSAGLKELAHHTADMFGIDCRYEEDGEEVTEPEHGQAIHLYHIAQEAVNNAVRHGEAQSMVIRMHRRHNGMALEIEDDGKGLPDDHGESSGMGLKIMRYRADMIGGRLKLEKNEPHGLRVICILPEEREELSTTEHAEVRGNKRGKG